MRKLRSSNVLVRALTSRTTFKTVLFRMVSGCCVRLRHSVLHLEVESSLLGDGNGLPIIQEDISLCLGHGVKGNQEREVVCPTCSCSEGRVLHWDYRTTMKVHLVGKWGEKWGRGRRRLSLSGWVSTWMWSTGVSSCLVSPVVVADVTSCVYQSYHLPLGK